MTLPKCPECGHKFPIYNSEFKWWTCQNMTCAHQWTTKDES